MVLCDNLVFSKQNKARVSLQNSPVCTVHISGKKKRFKGFVPNAKKNNGKKKKWWQSFFFSDDGNWLGLKEDDLVEGEEDNSNEEELSEDEKFEAWKRRAEAIVELREAQEDMKNEESRRWEDWIVEDPGNGSWTQDWDKGYGGGGGGEGEVDLGLELDSGEKGLVESVRDLVLGKEDDDILYEDRIFRYASLNSVSSFLGFVILIRHFS